MTIWNKKRQKPKNSAKNNQAFRASMIVIALLLFMLLLSLTACKTREVIVKTDSIYISKQRVDTFSLLQRDSVYVQQKGDTIIMRSYKTIYRDRISIKIDTVFKDVVKTITNKHPPEKKTKVPLFLYPIVVTAILFLLRKWIKKWLFNIISKLFK